MLHSSKNIINITKIGCNFDVNSQKLSPNILRVYHSDLLTEVKIRKAFKDYSINRITSPATRNGFWLIYAGDKNSYMALLSNRFLLGIHRSYRKRGFDH